MTLRCYLISVAYHCLRWFRKTNAWVRRVTEDDGLRLMLLMGSIAWAVWSIYLIGDKGWWWVFAVLYPPIIAITAIFACGLFVLGIAWIIIALQRAVKWIDTEYRRCQDNQPPTSP